MFSTIEPTSPEIDLDAFVKSTPNFQYALRINCDLIDQKGYAALDQLIRDHVIVRGVPIVFTGYQNRLDKEIFTVPWLIENCG